MYIKCNRYSYGNLRTLISFFSLSQLSRKCKRFLVITIKCSLYRYMERNSISSITLALLDTHSSYYYMILLQYYSICYTIYVPVTAINFVYNLQTLPEDTKRCLPFFYKNRLIHFHRYGAREHGGSLTLTAKR